MFKGDGVFCDLGLAKHVSHNIVLQHDRFDLCAAIAVGQVIADYLRGLLVVLGELFNLGADLLRLGLKLGLLDQLGHEQAQLDAALSLWFENVSRNGHLVGIRHATLLELLAGSLNAALGLGLEQGSGNIKLVTVKIDDTALNLLYNGKLSKKNPDKVMKLCPQERATVRITVVSIHHFSFPFTMNNPNTNKKKMIAPKYTGPEV